VAEIIASSFFDQIAMYSSHQVEDVKRGSEDSVCKTVSVFVASGAWQTPTAAASFKLTLSATANTRMQQRR